MNSSDSFFAKLQFHHLTYIYLLYSYRCAKEGLSSSEPYFQHMSLPLYRRILRWCITSSSHLPWSSHSGAMLDILSYPYDTAGFTLCYNLYFCSHSLEHFITTLYTYNFLYAQWLAKRLLDDYLYWTFTS
jgi:hypothetical protein